jgi:hypothetical protein
MQMMNLTKCARCSTVTHTSELNDNELCATCAAAPTKKRPTYKEIEQALRETIERQATTTPYGKALAALSANDLAQFITNAVNNAVYVVDELITQATGEPNDE